MRRLAFMSLDTSLTPSPVEIRLFQVATSPESFERLLVPSGWELDDDEFASIERHLARHIYNGPQALLAQDRIRPHMRRRFTDAISKNGLRNAVESSAASDHFLRPPGGGRQSEVVVRAVVASPWLTQLRLKPPPSLHKRRVEAAFERWSAAMGSTATLSLAQDVAGSEAIFQAHAHSQRSSDQATAIAGTAMLVNRLRHSLAKRLRAASGLDQTLIQRASRGIAEATLEHFFPNAECWEWGSDSGPHAFKMGDRDTALRALDGFLTPSPWTRNRLHEHSVLNERARTVQAQILVIPLVNVIALNPERTEQVAELDGIVVGIDMRRTDLVLTVIEAKLQQNGAEGAARRQLTDTLSKLGRRSSTRRSRIYSSATGRLAHAWVHLRSSYSS
jgi:hypothetical protein